MKENITAILGTPFQVLFMLTDSRDTALSQVTEYYEKNEKAMLSVFDTKQLRVEDISAIQKQTVLKGDTQKIIVISFYQFLREAQNKMLKTLEELDSSFRIIFITESGEGVLPTVLSRSQVFRLEWKKKEESSHVRLFLQTNPTLRSELPFVKVMLSQKDGDDKKDREAVTHFLSELLACVAHRNVDSALSEELLTFISLSKDKASSSKMILDYLAFRLPLMLE